MNLQKIKSQLYNLRLQNTFWIIEQEIFNQ